MKSTGNAVADCTAMYLRCYPHDACQMLSHQDILRQYARGLGLPEPVLYLDNGVRSVEQRPELELLLQHLAQGEYQVVLVPGPFVFSVDDREARVIVERIRATGCQVIELPSRRARWRSEP